MTISSKRHRNFPFVTTIYIFYLRLFINLQPPIPFKLVGSHFRAQMGVHCLVLTVLTTVAINTTRSAGNFSLYISFRLKFKKIAQIRKRLSPHSRHNPIGKLG